MDTYFFLFSAYVLIGCFCEVTNETDQFRDFVVMTDSMNTDVKKKDSYNCPNMCSNSRENTVMVQSAVDNRTNLNVPLNASVMAAVYYRCPTYSVERDLGSEEYHAFQRLCGNISDFCKEFPSSYQSEWYSISEKNQVLNVDLRLPIGTKDLKIMTRNCISESLIHEFKVNKVSIDYRSTDSYKYDGDIFFTNNLTQSPITLSLSVFKKSKVGDIIFNISESKCVDGWHQTSNNRRGYKCFKDVDGKNVEAGYPVSLCPGKNPPGRNSTVEKDFCGSDKERLCEDKCYNTENCSYICVKKSEDSLKEGGYLMTPNVLLYPDFIGSRRWKKNKVPIDLVSFNECKYSTKICDLGSKYCVDEQVGFSCSKGGFNFKKCFANKIQSPYWRCPANAAAISQALQTPELLKNENDSVFYKNQIMKTIRTSQTTKEGLKTVLMVMNTLSNNNSNITFNLPVKEKRSFASFLLKSFVDKFIKYYNSKDQDNITDDSFYFYKEDISTYKEEVEIPMSPGSKSEKNNTQYIKLELNRPSTRSTKKLTASYFQFKDLDLMDETEAIQDNVKNMRLIKDSKISPADYEDEKDNEEVLYKNSAMFSLKVDSEGNGQDSESSIKAIKFRLDTFQKVEPYSWLYEAEEVCGFLDESKNWSWSRKGCWLVKNVSSPYCECNHLSNFAMLFSMKEVNKAHLKAFEILSIIAAVINILSLTLFLIFVLFINSREKLRIDQLNIAICLLLGTLIFICGSFFVKNEVLCSLAALASQFLFLSAFVWKLILGINVVRLIASLRYQNEDWMVKYRWIMVSAGYSLPLLIVIIFGSVYWRDYGVVSDNVCWIDSSSKAFLSFLIPIGIIVAVNTLGLFFIANTLIRNYLNTRKTRINDSNEILVFVQLLVSMGLTWIPSYFATIYIYAMYLFVLFFPLQGLLMFLLVVVINKENREKVSSFLLNSYLTITSKSLPGSEGKSNSKSKSGQSKETEESTNLLADRDRSQEKEVDGVGENSLMVGVTEDGATDSVTKC